MTREEAKEAVKVMEAYANGKKIQYLNDNNEWVDPFNPVFDWSRRAYRIKPEPNYKPFTTKKECYDEMLKHQPFGWLIQKTEGKYNSIGCITEYNGFVYLLFATKEDKSFTAEFLFKNYKFADGTPFGIKE